MAKIKKPWVSWEELNNLLGSGWIPHDIIDAHTVGGLTPGSIPFADATGLLTEDNAALFWDAAEKNLGIGTNVFGANMEHGIQIATGVAPTASMADTFAFYSKDFNGGNACPHFRTEDGTIIGLNQSLFTTDTPTFDDLTITTPINIYALSHNSFADYAADEHMPALDEDDMASDSDTNVATQQSVKAYVDAQIAGVNEFIELTDTPANYVGSGGKSVKVNAAPDGLEFADLVKADITDTPWAWGDVLKVGSNLTDLATRQHAGLTDVTSDQHHAQLHAAAHAATQPDALSHNALADYAANRHFLATEIAFLNLSDTPAAYAGEGSKIVAVNVAENALEFIEAPSGGVSVPHPFLFLGY